MGIQPDATRTGSCGAAVVYRKDYYVVLNVFGPRSTAVAAALVGGQASLVLAGGSDPAAYFGTVATNAQTGWTEVRILGDGRNLCTTNSALTRLTVDGIVFVNAGGAT